MQAAGIPTDVPADQIVLPFINPDTLRPHNAAQAGKQPARKFLNRPRAPQPSKMQSDADKSDTSSSDGDEAMGDDDQEEEGDSVTEQKLREGVNQSKEGLFLRLIRRGGPLARSKHCEWAKVLVQGVNASSQYARASQCHAKCPVEVQEL